VKDINTSLQKAYYEAISATNLPVYEGEEPDNELSPVYVVISDITATDVSNKSKTGERATVQISVHSVKNKINNSVDLNAACDQILQAVKPDVLNTLTADGFQIVETIKTNDITTRNKLGDYAFVSRQIIFTHLIYYN
jgi:hypothetical protein